MAPSGAHRASGDIQRGKEGRCLWDEGEAAAEQWFEGTEAISLHLLEDGAGGLFSNAGPSKSDIRQLPGLPSVYTRLFQADDLSLVCCVSVLNCQFIFAHNLPWE